MNLIYVFCPCKRSSPLPSFKLAPMVCRQCWPKLLAMESGLPANRASNPVRITSTANQILIYPFLLMYPLTPVPGGWFGFCLGNNAFEFDPWAVSKTFNPLIPVYTDGKLNAIPVKTKYFISSASKCFWDNGHIPQYKHWASCWPDWPVILILVEFGKSVSRYFCCERLILKNIWGLMVGCLQVWGMFLNRRHSMVRDHPYMYTWSKINASRLGSKISAQIETPTFGHSKMHTSPGLCLFRMCIHKAHLSWRICWKFSWRTCWTLVGVLH